MILASITVSNPDPDALRPNIKRGSIRIEEMTVHPDGTADYLVNFTVDRISGIGYHRRSIHKFPKDQFNVLALLRQALMTLEEEELRHDGKTLS